MQEIQYHSAPNEQRQCVIFGMSLHVVSFLKSGVQFPVWLNMACVRAMGHAEVAMIGAGVGEAEAGRSVSR